MGIFVSSSYVFRFYGATSYPLQYQAVHSVDSSSSHHSTRSSSVPRECFQLVQRSKENSQHRGYAVPN